MPRNRKKNKAKAARAAAAAKEAAAKAAAAAQAAEELDESSPLFMKKQGVVAFKAGRFEDAVMWFSKALEVTPDDFKLFSNRSAARVAIATPKALRAALADAERCSEIAPEWAKGFYRAGIALKGLGRIPEAKAAMARAQALDPRDSAIADAVEELSTMKNSDLMPEVEGEDGDKDKFDLLEEWLRTPAQGETSVAEFPLLYMKRYSENNRGVHCRVNIRPDQRIMTIPVRYLMTVEMGKESVIGEKMIKYGVDVSAEKHCYLCVFTMLDRLNTESYFQPYYNILPTSYPNMPIFWSEEELSWLEGSYLLKQVEDRLHNIAEDYDEIKAAAPEWEQFTMEEFKWARMMVASRNFGVTIEGTRTDALVPYADMLNHYRPRETRWTFNQKENCFTITTIKALKAGQQVYDSYGKKCNSRFLLNYGFAVEENSDPQGQNHNEVRLLFQLRPKEEDPYYGLRMNLLKDGRKSRGIRVGTWYDYKHTLEAFSYLRFAYAEDTELMLLPPLTYELDLGKTPIQAISCENEIKVIQHMARLFRTQLARYPRSREEDEADLAAGTYELFSNHRNVIVVLRGEKIVCEYYIQLEKIVVPLLQMQWKHAKKVMNKMVKDAGPDLLKYCQMVVTPLLKKRASSGKKPVAVAATADTAAKADGTPSAGVSGAGAGAGAGAGGGKRKGRGRKGRRK